MTFPFRVLLLQEGSADAAISERILREAGIGFEPMRAKDEATYRAALVDFRPDIVLADYRLPNFDGLRALEMLRSIDSECPFIFVADAMDEALALASLALGANDYLLKDRLGRLPHAVKRALSEARKSARLTSSEECYRALVDTAGEAIVCIRDQDIITFWNRKAEQMFGYPATEAIGKSLHLLITPERYRAQAFAGLKLFYQTGNGANVGTTREVYALRRDGTEFPIELSVSAMKIEGQWQATGIARDITVRKRLQEELEVARRREREALELASLERMADGSLTSITEQTFGRVHLRENAPEFFDSLVRRFERTLDMALEQRVLRVDHPIRSELQSMADQLGAAKAGPRDAIDICVHALKELGQESTPQKALAYAEENRLLALELMGDLVSFYRRHSVGSSRRQATVVKPSIEEVSK